ncbi:AAA family ATPase [Thiotrichales bacterium 19X7-9]|nr:AAA family ATPase [Thiotrichales bacterium 19X7-9]
MSKPITHYGTSNASALMQGFHTMGNELLSNLLKYYSEPHERKTLRTWKMTDVCKMVGRSEFYIRNLEKESNDFIPLRDENGTRHYDLKLINRIRDKAGTRYKRPKGSNPIILAVSNFKGGVAKSETSTHLVQKCALDGLRCLVIDIDPQATTSLKFGYVPDIDVKAEETIKDALITDPQSIHNIIQPTYFEGIDIIPSNLSLSDLEITLSNIAIQQEQIKTLDMPNLRMLNAINLILDNYDVIVIDCGPNLGMLTINAVTAANSMLVPIPPMMNDLGSFVTFTGTLSALFKQLDKNFDFFRVVLTKHPESQLSKEIEILMREKFGAYILQKNIVNSVEIEKASSSFSSVYEMPKKSTKAYSRALTCLDSVNNEIIESYKYIWNAQSEVSLKKDVTHV